MYNYYWVKLNFKILRGNNNEGESKKSTYFDCKRNFYIQ